MTTGKAGIEESERATTRGHPDRPKADKSRDQLSQKRETAEAQQEPAEEGRRQAVQATVRNQPKQHDTLRTPLVRAWAAPS